MVLEEAIVCNIVTAYVNGRRQLIITRYLESFLLIYQKHLIDDLLVAKLNVHGLLFRPLKMIHTGICDSNLFEPTTTSFVNKHSNI